MPRALATGLSLSTKVSTNATCIGNRAISIDEGVLKPILRLLFVLLENGEDI